MSYTKRQFVEGAFEEIGLAEYVFDVQPEGLQGALRRLDAMMADWAARGINLAYPMPDNPQDSGLDTQTDVPDRAWQAIVTNLAVRLAPTYGKQVMMETKAAARSSLDALLRHSITMRPVSSRSIPAGAGNKPSVILGEYLGSVGPGLTTGNGDELEFS